MISCCGHNYPLVLIHEEATYFLVSYAEISDHRTARGDVYFGKIGQIKPTQLDFRSIINVYLITYLLIRAIINANN